MCLSNSPCGLYIGETKQEYLTFTIGQEGSPDVTAARMMSEYLGTTHYEYLFTSEEAGTGHSPPAESSRRRHHRRRRRPDACLCFKPLHRSPLTAQLLNRQCMTVCI